MKRLGLLTTLLTISMSANVFAAGIDSFKQSAPGAFSDVSQNDWFYDTVSAVSAYGIINGMDDTHFNPQGNLTIGQALTLAAKVHAIYHDSEIPATSGSHWAQGALDYAVSNNICSGISVSDLDNLASRGVMAWLFYNAVDASEFTATINAGAGPATDNSALKEFYRAGIMTDARENDNVTRAEAAAIILRVIDSSKRMEDKNDADIGSTSADEEVVIKQLGPADYYEEMDYNEVHWDKDVDVSGLKDLSEKDGLYVSMALVDSSNINVSVSKADLSEDAELVLMKDDKVLETVKLSNAEWVGNDTIASIKFNYKDYRDGETYRFVLKDAQKVLKLSAFGGLSMPRNGEPACDITITHYLEYVEDESDEVSGYTITGSKTRVVGFIASVLGNADKRVKVVNSETKEVVPNLNVTLTHEVTGTVYNVVSDSTGYLNLNINNYSGAFAITSVAGAYEVGTNSLSITDTRETEIQVTPVQ